MLARVKSLYGALIQLSAKLNLPRIAALLVVPCLHKMKADVGADARTIVVLPKDGFTQDVMSALSAAPALAVIGLPRMVLHRLSRGFLPYFMDNNNYISCGAEFDSAKLKYRHFLKVLFRVLRRFVRIDAMMSGNFAYAAERELASAMSEMGIPFIVLHKENLKTPGALNFFERIYRERRGPFTGHKILVYNEIERDLQIRSGIVKPRAVEIVGMPRLDRVHAWRRANAGSTVPNRILFFVFSPETGIPRLGRKLPTYGSSYYETPQDEGEKISLSRLSAESCRVLVRIARENPEISLVVKSKGRLKDYADTALLFDVKSEAELPKNMQIVHGGDIMPLISDASVVCGFNSTALLESVAAGKPVVIPWFAEAESPRIWPYLVDLRNICMIAQSPDDLYEKLIDLAHHPIPTPAELEMGRRQSLALWTGNDDGYSALRTRNAILRELDSGIG